MGDSLLARNRRRLEVALSATNRRRLFSPAMLGLYSTLAPRIERHASGKLLDAGCGTMPFRPLAMRTVASYQALDAERRTEGVDLIGDVQAMVSVPDATFDTVLCSEVLEHVPRPSAAIREFARVLLPGGTLLLTVPYLSRLHEEPHDYFRFTSYGLRVLLDDAGFDAMEIATTGSVLSFLGHQFSSIAVCAVWHIPVVRDVVFWANALLCAMPCCWADRVLGLGAKLPLGYVVVAKKRVTVPL